ncbi:hypothetical protein DC498_14010 [Terrimonas sp.]|uniref:hypothetical protein n=1 Tax=Terrimonas sp. TaxID=1914338 RepID=UPI000D5066CA|nr:hypothetical protein [Terrimonas sp.]PVD51536.1 hypothetical protein DC498_14010 [Terrimonas sp.]
MQKKYSISLLFVMSFFYGTLFAHNEKEIFNTQQTSIKNSITSDYSDDKFTYAELVFQRALGQDKFWVTGINVSKEIGTAVSVSKYRDEAIEIIGKNGWEMVSTLIRNFDGGFEIFYYFKKKII